MIVDLYKINREKFGLFERKQAQSGIKTQEQTKQDLAGYYNNNNHHYYHHYYL